MRKITYFIGIILACGLFACSGNDDVDVIEPWGDEYELPQGGSDADNRIVEYYERYGTYILYDYSYLDYRYEFSGYSSYNYELPDPVYVGNMLDLLEDIWFDFYPEEFHREFMPLKIMLSRYFEYENTWSGTTTSYFALMGSNAIGIGHCTDTLRELAPEVKLEFKNDLQRELWASWVDRLDVPDEFYAVSDYSSVASADPASDDYTRKRGFIANYVNDPANEWSTTSYPASMTEWTMSVDLQSFLVAMVVRTSAEWASDLEYPLVKQKYDILRNWLQGTYGFDLQGVGDATYE